ncbi:hypothetical protein [Sorangium sp. So ce233]
MTSTEHHRSPFMASTPAASMPAAALVLQELDAGPLDAGRGASTWRR